MAVTLHAVEETAPDPLPFQVITSVYLVIWRSNGHWSPGAKIMSVHGTEAEAEDHAAKMKAQQPQQVFAVFALRSEARQVLHPIEIVRVNDAPQGSA